MVRGFLNLCFIKPYPGRYNWDNATKMNNMKIEVMPSRLFEKEMDTRDQVAALRFMLSMPVGHWFHVNSLPDYVFEWIYIRGALVDLPWIEWIDSDTGQMIYRQQRTENPLQLFNLCKKSQFMHSIGISYLLTLAFHESIGVDKFEQTLLNILKLWQK